MKILLLILGFVMASSCLVGQKLIQTVRGKVIDQETHFPLPGATVMLIADSSSLTGVTTNEHGDFRFEKVSVGRYTLRISFIGYKDSFLDNVLVSSAKEVMLTILLKEATINLQEITVTAGRDGDAANEMAIVSSRSFTIEETQRYAGSRGDPARMASNFAGVQGADDSRNDIIIRGNSPQGVLWRMEGINIPNPNHFNIPGTAGGPVSMINNQTLANSDFFSGAFPAEYGNSISGVFDLKLRNGNNEKHEHSAQFGFLGTEIFSEGPLSQSHTASYLFSYRYSTLALFNKLGIDIGTSAVPRYQDIAFKFNFPLKRTGSLSLFGLGGKSNVDILISDQEQPDRNIYGENDRDQYFKSGAGVLGLSYKKPINVANYFQATVAVSSEVVSAYHELVYRHLSSNQYVLDSLQPLLDYHFRQNKVSGSLLYSKKINSGVLHFGLNTDLYLFSLRDSVRNINKNDAQYYQWRNRWNSSDQSFLVQPFVQWKYSLSPKLDVVAGLHSQYFSLSESFVPVEPRAGLKLAVSEKSTVNVGAGMHSQIQPTYLYFYGQTNDAKGNPVPHNSKMDFTRSVHLVAGYERFLRSDFRVKGEIYYQYLYHVPVEKKGSSFSLLNTGASFSRFFPDTLINTGIGTNYGIELTAEKFFSKGYLFLITGSVFDSRYQGSDAIWRDTDFNGNFVLNLLFTKEWFLKNRNTLAVGGKMTTAGGRRYGPVDIASSERDKEVVWVDATRNSLQFRPYFRTDIRINYRINRPMVTHEISVDLVNVLGIENILKLTYAPNDVDLSASPVREEYQLGFLPLFYYRIDF
ncbi:MAG: carboxypeptidase-like regulatory domain-containing protein [Cyclobacteriaceae bacterium]